MPTTYAHWAFGRDCIELMPKDLQNIIREHRDIYDLAVHGPDILFYDLSNKAVTKCGVNIHHTSGFKIFAKAKESYKRFKDKDKMLTYIAGFLTHYTLDSTCHTYVETKRKHANITHNCVEGQWDRHVMELDGRVPNLVDRSESLKPSKDNAKIISYFYPFNQKAILKTCKWQVRIIRLVNSISPIKEKYFRKALTKLELNNYADLFMGQDELDVCKDSNLRLDKLRAKALKLYPKLLKNVLAYINDESELIKYFENDLEDRKDEIVPVLPIEEEIDYIVK